MTVPAFKLDQLNDFLLRKQHLSGPAREVTLEQIARDVGGLHATGATVPFLSVWSRIQDFAKEELKTDLFDKRTLAKVLCMRNTLFILPKELLPVAYQATRKRRDALIDRYLRHHGISRRRYQHICAAIKELLDTGAKTAAEIKEELADASISIVVDLMPNDWQLIRGCPRGTWRSNLHEYSSFDACFPDVNLDSLTPEQGQARLVRHYLSSLGPATEEDIVWWTGLGKLEVKRALARIEEQVSEIEVEGLGGPHLTLTRDLNALEARHDRGPCVHLLPSLDPYIMGYKDRRRFLDPQRYKQVFDRAGNALPTVWLKGQVIGVWLEDRKRTSVEVLLFEEADKDTSTDLQAEARRLSQFLEHDAANVQIKLYPADAYPKTPFSLARRQ